ncbi:unnamed protein product, partial [Mesorhabditis spiculigera]
MTVPYHGDVANVSLGSWMKLVFRWRGSVWKSVLTELLIWLGCYYVTMFIYRSDLVLSHRGQESFERLVAHVNARVSRIPLTFMLGFFVSQVVDRWRQVLLNMGYIENAALTAASLVRGNDERTRIIRRSMVRYLVLSQVLVFRDIAISVRRRFPTMRSIVQAGFLQDHELEMLEKVKLDDNYNKYWVPINWACALCFKLRDISQPNQDPNVHGLMHVSHMNYLLNEFKFFRNNLQTLCNFDWVPIPLAYPQVVFLSVRVYFLICIVGRQFIVGQDSPNRTQIDLYFPMMTVLEFIFFVGWMRVAEALLNPFGEDDDDFECNFLIDKNIATGLAIVDAYDEHPVLNMDQFKTQQGPIYSEESQKHGHHQNVLVGSVAQVNLAKPDDDVKMVELQPLSAAPSTESVPTFAQSFMSNLRPRKKTREFSLRPAHRVRSHSTNFAPVSPNPTESPKYSFCSPTASIGMSRYPSQVSRYHSSTEGPFDISFAPSVLANDVVHEVDLEEEDVSLGRSKHFKPHHIASRISEVSEEDQSPVAEEKFALSLEKISERGSVEQLKKEK